MKPVRTKKASRRNSLESVNTLFNDFSDLARRRKEPLNTPQNATLNAEYERYLAKLKGFKKEMLGTFSSGVCSGIKSHFIYKETLYAITEKDTHYTGVNIVNGEIVQVRRNHCIFISKNEDLLIFYYLNLWILKDSITQKPPKPIPFNEDQNEYHDKWSKYQLIMAYLEYDYVVKMIITIFKRNNERTI